MQNKTQLFCFTYAGGTASFFDNIKKYLENVEVISLEYSGHGKRFKEPFYKNFNELADDMYEEIEKNYKGGMYALFGYSMGTISVVEVLRRIIEKKTIKLPNYIFLAAHEPFTKNVIKNFSESELDNFVKERTIGFGGVPEELINNKSFWRMYLPLYRTDYSIIHKYSFEKLELKTTIPAVIFYSENDTPFNKMKYWYKYFIEKCEYYEFEGTHFFMKEHYIEIANIIKEKIGAINDI
ncbi:Surfactin synthase thioesterase subunit [Treponema bryantii]|uniref:Surfactin synthase thioesterase subunit n=1 Tax=Treponema bryantii TaxID=163 RepID=A0A1I3N9H0_9SPIR|nr:thioesterase domain-containing protein [Treponema bryantii]SFJ05953.1 Surfactin synthase thioesterase subunit [Treponema bryantii]